MSTAYEVLLTLADQDSATRPLADVLARTLADDTVGLVAPDYSTALEHGRMRVRVLVDAEDESAARSAATTALDNAAREAGLPGSAVAVADAEVRPRP